MLQNGKSSHAYVQWNAVIYVKTLPGSNLRNIGEVGRFKYVDTIENNCKTGMMERDFFRRNTFLTNIPTATF